MVAMNKGDWVGTKAQYVALSSVESNRKYYITDLETFVITNSAMASALTTYSGLYANGDTFLCIDSGTYKQNTFYKLNSGAWVEMGSLVTNAEKSKWDSKPENYQIISRPSSIPTANATSPDFVQVDGVTYKKVATFSSAAVSDLTGTRWLFNDTPTAPAEDIAKLINFTSNNESFTAMVLAHYNWATSGMIYGNDTVYNGNDGWTAEGYKEIVIVDGRDVQDTTLIDWLSANATQVAYEYNALLNTTNTASKVYGTDSNGDQTTYDTARTPQTIGEDKIPLYNAAGCLKTNSPTWSEDTTPKSYVDGLSMVPTNTVVSQTTIPTASSTYFTAPANGVAYLRFHGTRTGALGFHLRSSSNVDLAYNTQNLDNVYNNTIYNATFVMKQGQNIYCYENTVSVDWGGLYFVQSGV